MGKRSYLLLPLVLLVSADSSALDQFSVKETGDNLELVTPWGTKTLVGDIGFKNNGNYKIEIPLSDLKPVYPSKNTTSDNDSDDDKADHKREASKKKSKSSKEDADADDDDDADDFDTQKVADKDRKPQSLPPLAPLVVEYDDTDKLVIEANHFYNQGKFFEASEDVEEILRKKPDYVRGWIMKGSLMYVQNQKDLAKKSWEKAQSLEPTNPQVKTLLERYK